MISLPSVPRAAGFLFMLAFFTGCAKQRAWDHWRDSFVARDFARLAAQHAKDACIASPVPPFRRLAWVSEVDDVKSKRPVGNEPGYLDVQSSRNSTAVAISNDGYFLTTAHSLRGNVAKLTLSVLVESPADGAPDLEIVPFRVVWQGQAASDAVGLAPLRNDVALIHAKIRTRAVNLAPRSPKVGENVWVLGLSPTRFQDGRWLISNKAKIRSTRPLSQGFLSVEHSGILFEGDSGGPIINASGELLGINYAMLKVVPTDPRGELPNTVDRSLACCVQPTLLQQLLQQDRASKGGG